MLEKIAVRGARQNNLKNIDLEIPRDKITVITGISGSGKSSLAFDTIYAEGERRYIESLSVYARQFLEQMQKPDVDSIEGLSPAIAIEQRTAWHSPRSTVGTATEIYDYLRLLFSSIGVPHCHICGKRISRQSLESIVDSILALSEGERVVILAPVVRERKGEFKKQFEKYLKQGFARARVDGLMRSLEEDIRLDKRKKHTIEIVVDRLLVKPGIRRRLEDSLRKAMDLANGLVTIAILDKTEQLFSEKQACVDCGISIPLFEPRSFSFNSKFGACPACEGLGSRLSLDPRKLIADEGKPIGELEFNIESRRLCDYISEMLIAVASNFGATEETPFRDLPQRAKEVFFFGSQKPLTFYYGKFAYSNRFQGISSWLERQYTSAESDRLRADLERLFAVNPCQACQGARLRPESLAVKVAGKSIADYCALSLQDCLKEFEEMKLGAREEKIAGQIVSEIAARLRFLVDVGVGYLSLDRPISSLSGGECQRVRLATQIGSQLRGVLYVLDEPSIGLHARDHRRLLDILEQLRDLGNTIVIVEHDEETIRSADYIVDLGPGAGTQGGRVVAAGDLRAICGATNSLTAKYLTGELRIEVPEKRRKGDGRSIIVRGATHNNLKNIDVRFPLGVFIAVTGVSGSGKSSLVDEILYRALAKKIYRSIQEPGAHRAIEGIEHIDKVIEIDQSPIGRTPRSNPATYTGLFTHIRQLFAMLPESRMRGYKAGRFSFNVKGGRCQACEGDGLRRIEMSFLPDVYVTCEACQGARYNKETLAVKYKGYSVADILNMTARDALPLLQNIPAVRAKLQTLIDVGLDYIKLGQPATTLSGGEAQRIKLARELSKRATGRTLYILDEPTTGLHLDDVRKLLYILNRLVDMGNTVIVIEHHLDVIKVADWIIDLGPEGGEGGGHIVAEGTPEMVAMNERSHTGRALRRVLELATRAKS